MSKKALDHLPKVEIKVSIIPKNGASYTWHSEDIKGIGALETHRDYLTPQLARYVYREIKQAIYAKGLSAVKVDINNKRYSCRRYITSFSRLVVDIHTTICEELRKVDENV